MAAREGGGCMGMRNVRGTLKLLLGLGLCFTGFSPAFAQDLAALKQALDIAEATRANALAAYQAALLAAENASKDSTALALALTEAQKVSAAAVLTYANTTKTLTQKKAELATANTARLAAVRLAASAAQSLKLAESNLEKTSAALVLAETNLASSQANLASKTSAHAAAKLASDQAKAALAKDPKNKTLIANNNAALAALATAARALSAASTLLSSNTTKLVAAGKTNATAVLTKNTAKTKSDSEASKLSSANSAYDSSLQAFNTATDSNTLALASRNAALIAVSQANFNLVKAKNMAIKAQLAVSAALAAFGLADINYLKAKAAYEAAYDAQVATSLALSGIPATRTAGSSFTVTVTAMNAKGKVATGYPEQVSVVSSDGNAILPQAITLTKGVGTFTISLVTAGSSTLEFASGDLNTSSEPILVTPSTFSTTKSVLAALETVVSGESVSLTLTLKDEYGNLEPSNSPPASSVSFTTSLVGGTGTIGTITSPSKGVYEASFTGVKVGTLSIGAIASSTTLSLSSPMDVTPGQATDLVLASVPKNTAAGNAFTLEVIAKDKNGNTATDSEELVTILSDDALAKLPEPMKLTSGIGSFEVTLVTAGFRKIKAGSDSLMSLEAEVSVDPGEINILALSGYSTSILSGESVTVNVSAFDAYSNLLTSEKTPLEVTSSDPTFTATQVSLEGGSASFNAILSSPGLQTISVSLGNVIATTDPIEVGSLATPTPIPQVLVQVSGGAKPCAGVLIQSEFETGVVLPAACVAGASAQDLLVTYADQSTGVPVGASISGEYDPKLMPHELAYLGMDGSFSSAISYPSEIQDFEKPVSGFLFGWTDEILSDGNNFSTLASSILDPKEGGALDPAFDANLHLAIDHKEEVTLPGGIYLVPEPTSTTGYLLQGVQTLTVATRSMIANFASSFTQKWFENRLNEPVKLIFAASQNEMAAGESIHFTIEAMNASGKLAAGFSGQVTVLSSDPLAETPASVEIAGGVGSFDVILKSAGPQIISIFDETLGTTSADIKVGPGAAVISNVVLAAESESVIAGESVKITCTLHDQFGNSAPTGIPDASEIIFFTIGKEGSGTFGALVEPGTGVFETSFSGTTAGKLSIGVTIGKLGDASTPLSYIVFPGAAASISVESAPIKAVAGDALSFSFSLSDSFGNLATTDPGSAFTLSGNSGLNCDGAAVASSLAGTTSSKFSAGRSDLDSVSVLLTKTKSILIESGALSACVPNLQVSSGPIQNLEWTIEPAPLNVMMGSVFDTQPVFTGFDAYSNPITEDSGATVSLAAMDAPDCSGTILPDGLGGSISASFIAGSAAFTDVSILDAATKSIQARSGDLTACFSGFSFGNPPVAIDLASDATFATPAKSNIIFLSYKDTDGDLATSCTVSGLVNLTVSSACSCSKGICQVSILGANGQTSGSFDYTVTAGGVNSNTAKASVSIYPSTTLAFSPTSRYYGWIGVGETGAGFDFTITNSGSTQALNCSAPTLASDANFRITSDTCGTANLAAGSSCKVRVAPIPGSAASLTTTLSRDCLNVPTASNSTATNGLSVTGRALAGTSVSYGTSPLDFGNVRSGGSSYTREYVFTNTGFGSASCSAPTLSNTADFSIVSDGCSNSSLTRGAACSVFVKANPASAGAKSATLTRTCGASSATISLSATGSTSPGATVADIGSGAGFSSVNATYRGFTCVVMSSGGVQCWGGNLWGQLGNGTLTTALTPVNVTGISTATSISVGNYFACVILADTTVRCWGANTVGQTGNTTLSATAVGNTPVQVSNSSGPLTNIVALSAGAGHSCAIRSDGTVWCWGLGTSGQLGNGGTANSALAVQVTGITTARTNDRNAISAGNTHSCVVHSNGSASCWGFNGSRQLGNNSTTNSTVPVSVASLGGGVRGVATGSANSCFVFSSGVIKCVGTQQFGNLGNGVTNTTTIGVPTQVTGITTATGVYGISNGHTFCAVLTDQTARCWGRNSYGVLNNGNTTNQATPVTVSGISGITKISIGDLFACASTTTTPLRCWGNNSTAESGGGELPYLTVPKTASIVSSFGAISSMGSATDYSCALLTNGTVRCWGSNTAASPQLGDGTSVTNLINPVQVSGITTATALAVGDGHNCVILQDKTVRCWGSAGSNSALGNSANTASATPVTVTGINSAEEIALGRFFGCVRLTNGNVRCWGYGTYGQQGNGVASNQSAPVSDVLNVSNAIQIAAGYDHACALLSSGGVRCWGYNGLGQLGDGTMGATTWKSTPVAVTGITNAIAISAGTSFSCAVLADNTVRCWGSNANGTLGDNATLNRSTPVAVTTFEGNEPLTRITSIESHATITCGLRSTQSGNQVVCWGNNSTGGLGIGIVNTTNYRRAVEVPGLTNISSLTGGPIGTTLCAIDSAGNAKCFGDNTLNMAGQNGYATRAASGF